MFHLRDVLVISYIDSCFLRWSQVYGVGQSDTMQKEFTTINKDGKTVSLNRHTSRLNHKACQIISPLVALSELHLPELAPTYQYILSILIKAPLNA